MFPQREFYTTCTPLTGLQSAAFRSKYYLHRFLKHFRRSGTSLTFLEDATNDLAKFDRRPELAAPIVQVAPGTTTTLPTLATAISAMQISSAAAISTVDPQPSSHRSQSPAVAGPSPTTMANHLVAALTEVERTFRAIEDEDDEGEAAIRLMDALGEPARTVGPEGEGEDMEIDELEEDDGDDIGVKGKGKGRAGGDEWTPEPRVDQNGKRQRSDEETESDWDQYKRSPKIVVKRPSVRRSIATAGISKHRTFGRPTGNYFDPPCSTCHLAGRVCERNVRGGSCTHCKVSKRACEYAKPQTAKRVKSKPTIDSEDDEDKGPHDRADCDSSPMLHPQPSRPRRAAGKRAMQAIRGEIVIPTLQPLVPVTKKTSTRRCAAVKSKGQ
jgi:hypothetical protein